MYLLKARTIVTAAAAAIAVGLVGEAFDFGPVAYLVAILAAGLVAALTDPVGFGLRDPRRPPRLGA